MSKHNVVDLIELINVTIPENSIRNSLVDFLDKLKLTEAPASGALRYHHAYTGGLVDHIIDVFTIAKDLNATHTHGSPVPILSVQDILLVSILHDIHKTQDSAGQPYYQANILKSGKRSEAEPFEHNDGYLKQACVSAGARPVDREVDFLYREAVDSLPGGVKSLALLIALAPALYASLSDEVKFAIRYHDGVYAHNKYELAGKETPLMILFHAADMLSSRLNRIKS